MKHVTSPSSVQPSTSKRCPGTIAVECGVGPSTSGTWYSALSRATKIITSSLCRGRDHTLSQKCSDPAPTSSRPSTTRSSSTHGTSSSYVIFTLSICMYPCKLRMVFLKYKNAFFFAISSLILSDTQPQQRHRAALHSRVDKSIPIQKQSLCLTPSHVKN